ncbi:hypothetical protein [Synechococcus sp. WH 7805]|uniref:hypothetical protein n=1 Tax=Synechococcus sp. (strain WH7805) TaxID=59931 RepID=UPI001E504120|nr:hypothetical protein [Synechococcus sp. WH 7805]
MPARALLAMGGVVLIWGSPGEIGTRSKGADSWEDETSFAALQLRALGALKMGAGLGLLGASLAGVSNEQTKSAAHRLAVEAAAKTEPKPQPPASAPKAPLMPPNLPPPPGRPKT